MAGKSKAISDELLARCKEALKNQGKQGEIGRRLQAIISAKTHGILAVAEVYGITRATLMRWIKSFEEKSEQGLVIKHGRGRKRIFSASEEEIMLEELKNNPNITIKQLMVITKTKLKTTASEATVHRVTKRLGFAYITPRALH